MTLRLFRNSAAFVLVTVLLAGFISAQNLPSTPESPYGGTTVEDIIARVNDQIITRSDYDRALAELDQDFTDRKIIITDTADGKPLTPAEGPFRVIVQDEKKPARCVKQVISIKIISAE